MQIYMHVMYTYKASSTESLQFHITQIANHVIVQSLVSVTVQMPCIKWQGVIIIGTRCSVNKELISCIFRALVSDRLSSNIPISILGGCLAGARKESKMHSFYLSCEVCKALLLCWFWLKIFTAILTIGLLSIKFKLILELKHCTYS